MMGTIVLLLAIIAAIGFYRGWFVAHSSNTPNQSEINVTVDKNAVHRDETQVQDQAHDDAERIKRNLSTSPSANP
jgi:hypothetical protein